MPPCPGQPRAHPPPTLPPPDHRSPDRGAQSPTSAHLPPHSCSSLPCSLEQCPHPPPPSHAAAPRANRRSATQRPHGPRSPSRCPPGQNTLLLAVGFGTGPKACASRSTWLLSARLAVAASNSPRGSRHSASAGWRRRPCLPSGRAAEGTVASSVSSSGAPNAHASGSRATPHSPHWLTRQPAAAPCALATLRKPSPAQRTRASLPTAAHSTQPFSPLRAHHAPGASAPHALAMPPAREQDAPVDAICGPSFQPSALPIAPFSAPSPPAPPPAGTPKGPTRPKRSPSPEPRPARQPRYRPAARPEPGTSDTRSPPPAHPPRPHTSPQRKNDTAACARVR
jgi:hypothetical protein